MVPEINCVRCVFGLFSPELTWRDIQHLTVLTSKRNSLFDAKNRFHWTMNGVGLEYNHLFGFGVLDAGGIVSLAKQWTPIPPRYHCDGGVINKPQYDFRSIFHFSFTSLIVFNNFCLLFVYF